MSLRIARTYDPTLASTPPDQDFSFLTVGSQASFECTEFSPASCPDPQLCVCVEGFGAGATLDNLYPTHRAPAGPTTPEMIPYPDRWIATEDRLPNVTAETDQTRTVMRTVRVPLSGFLDAVIATLDPPEAPTVCGQDWVCTEWTTDFADLWFDFAPMPGESYVVDDILFELAGSEEDIGACGDGLLNGMLEECEKCDRGLHPEASCPDGTVELGGVSCGDLGFNVGFLTCSSECRFDTAGCQP
jgi:hypothetical protein